MPLTKFCRRRVPAPAGEEDDVEDASVESGDDGDPWAAPRGDSDEDGDLAAWRAALPPPPPEPLPDGDDPDGPYGGFDEDEGELAAYLAALPQPGVGAPPQPGVEAGA